MTQDEWKIHYRNIRAVRRERAQRAPLSYLVSALRDLYGYLYTPEQDAFIRLVERYKNKLDSSYLEKIDGWKPGAKKRAEELLKKEIYSPNPFLSMIGK